MSHPTFTKGLQSFSRVLSQVPQDDLPSDLVKNATQLLASLREDPGHVAFGLQQGKPFLPSESNLALGITLVWQNEWKKKNPIKAIWLDAHRFEEKETQNLYTAFDFEDERDLFVANKMVGFLEDQHQQIPDDLRAFLGGRHGFKEKE